MLEQARELLKVRSGTRILPKVVGIGVVLIGAYLLMRVAYTLDWTGFAGSVAAGGETQRAKTLWDWLELLTIPIVLASSLFWLGRQRLKAEREIQQQRAQTERETAQTLAFRDYVDHMADLLLEKQLRTAGKDTEARRVARLRTLTLLQRLEENHKAAVVRFLYESGLINKETVILDLQRADLSGVNLSGAELSGLCLSGAKLNEANLNEAVLNQADLRAADLRGAYLYGAKLFSANLGKAHLVQAYMHEVNLCNANLAGADLRGADLRGANLSGADLRGADLRWANLRGVELSGANLRWADLHKAKIVAARLSQAKSLNGATLPDGNRYVESESAPPDAPQAEG
jgi:uncharacterized protein YjbI with pentapeptide repeats